MQFLDEESRRLKLVLSNSSDEDISVFYRPIQQAP
jgi:hypothetical protein